MSPRVPGWRQDALPPSAPVGSPPSRRRVVGYVYELFTSAPDLDSDHPYVGQTSQTVHQRVHGRGGHTSPASVAKDPWKGRILPGAAGYRILERVRDTGEGDQANEDALRRAEAFWIDRLRPRHNGPRPVRPPKHEAGPVPVKRRPISQAELVARAQRRRASRRLARFALLSAVGTWLAVQLVLAMHLPWGAAPWVLSPALGVFGGWLAFTSLDRAWAILTGRHAPRRRRRYR